MTELDLLRRYYYLHRMWLCKRSGLPEFVRGDVYTQDRARLFEVQARSNMRRCEEQMKELAAELGEYEPIPEADDG